MLSVVGLHYHTSPVFLPSEYFQLWGVPQENCNLQEVFNKARATSLPPHHNYGCYIELLSGATPPRGHLFSLSTPETNGMEKCMQESLVAGII